MSTGANMTMIVLTIVYFVFIIAVGLYFGRHAKNLDDYMVGGRNLGTIVTTFSVLAAVMSGWTWLGNPGLSYTIGYSSMVRLFSMGPLGLVISYFLLAKPIRIISEKKNCYTLPDVLSARFNGNPVIRFLSSIIILIGCMTYLVSQWSSMGTVLQPILGVSYEVAVIIGAVVISIYIVLGGMMASVWVNFFQMLIMFVVAFILLFKSVGSVGGLTQMNVSLAAIDPQYVAPWWQGASNGIVYILSYSILVLGFGYGGQPAVNTKFMMVRDKKQFRWAPLIASVALIMGTTTYFAGMAGKVLVEQGAMAAPERPDLILLSVIGFIFQPSMASLVMVAVLAAVMSTAESHLFNSAAAIVNDLVYHVFHVEMEKSRQLWLNRIMMAIVTVITVLIAMNTSDLIANIGAQAFGAFCCGFGPVLYLGMRWKRVNSKAAIAGMLVGLIMGGLIPLLNSSMFGTWSPAGLGLILAALVIIVVTMVSKPEKTDVFD